MRVAGVGGGAVIGSMADNLLKNMNPMMRGGLKIAVGAVVPEFIPMRDKSLVEDIGSGIIASGAIDLAKNLMPSAGGNENVEGIHDELDQFEDEGYVLVEDDDMSGLDEDSPIFGDEDSPISGDDDFVDVE